MASRILTFKAPTIRTTLALAMPEVLEVTTLAHIRPVPFAPAPVSGVVVWRSATLTVFDLPTLLTGQQGHPTGTYLIAQLLLGEEQRALLAFPVLEGTHILTPPQRVFTQSSPFAAEMVRASFLVELTPITLLNLEGCLQAVLSV